MKYHYFLLRITLAAAASFLVIMATGCWDDAEINGRAFVLGFGADSGQSGDGYDFTFQLAIPVSGESNSQGSIEYTNCTVNAHTPAEAISLLEKNLGRQINFEQISLIVIGEPLSRRFFLGLTDYFFRRASVRRQSCIAVCQGSAKEFFAFSATDKAVSADAAVALQSYGDTSAAHSLSMDLFTLYKTVTNLAEFYLLKIAPTAADSQGKNAARGENPQPAESEENVILSISGACVYGRKGDYRGEISEDELEMLRLIAGSRTSGALAVKDSRSGEEYCCQIRQSDCSTKCELSGGLPTFHIRLTLVLVPLDTGGEGGGYSGEFSGRICRLAEQTVASRLEAISDRSRASLGSSVLGLQDIVRQRLPDWYAIHRDDWENIYASSTVSISVSCRTAGGGITR